MIENLKNIEIFKDFPEDVLKELEPYITVTKYNKGDFIIKEGTVGDITYIIEYGEVEVLKQDKLLTIISEGNIFGEMAFFDNVKRTADVVARKDTTIYKISSKDFKKFILEHPQDGIHFLFKNIQTMAGRLRETSRNFVTVFETGKIVGGNYNVHEMTEKILGKLLRDIEDVTGGMIALYNPITDSYDISAQNDVKLIDLNKAIDLINTNNGENIYFNSLGGVVFGTALWNNDKILGYIFLEKGGHQKPFTNDQEIIVLTVSNQVCLGIMNAYNRQEDEARQRLEQSRMRRY